MLKNMDDFIKAGSEEAALFDQLDLMRLPQHVAVIMDGNGRWAKRRNRPRIEGHRAGSKSVQDVVETCARIEIPYLTLFAFSKENWKRPKTEVDMLWRLLEDYLKNEDKALIKNNLRLKVIGQRDKIPVKVIRELERVEQLTADNSGLTIILALNYGGRAEIVDAVKKIAKTPGVDIDSLDEESFASHLYTDSIPDPDLLIRTSGEIRVSNFLLWQIAYSEIWITEEYWPDFRRKHLLQAILDYQKRERRFGDIRPR